VNDLPSTAGAVVKNRFGSVSGGDIYFLPFVHIGDAALGHSIRYGFLYLAFKAADKALPIDSTFILST
jgi:hypothetical protein